MKGVVTYLENLSSDEIRLVMDDVNSHTDKSSEWFKTVLFTHNDYQAKELFELNLSQEQFAYIGENLVIRLLALNGKLK